MNTHGGCPNVKRSAQANKVFHQLKQVDLAKELDISKSHLSEIESGKKTVSMDLLYKYSDYFSVPASSLMMFSENMEAAKNQIN